MLRINKIINFIKGRIWLKYSLMIVFFSFLFLFARKPTTSTGTYCGEYIKVSHLGFVLFCDSYQYIYLTSQPELLLDSSFVAVRQNRPLYIYVAHVIGQPIKFILDKFIVSSFFQKINGEKYLYQNSINEKLASSPFLKTYHIENHKNLVVELLPYYIAFIVLNFIILLTSLIVFERLLQYLKTEQFIINFLSLFIVCSGLVKAFFFSAHEQMFVFFTPISIAYIIFHFFKNELTHTKLYIISFGMGLLCLAYGSFILFFPSLGIAYLIKQKSLKLSVNMVKDLLPILILFVLPSFTWMFICIHFSGHYFNGEVSTFREFVWIKDALEISLFQFLKVVSNFFIRFVYTVLITLTPFLIGILVLNKIQKSKSKLAEQKDFFNFLNWMFFLFFCFFFLLGYYNFRLTYTCVPILLLIIAIKMQYLIANNFIEKGMLYKSLQFLSILWIVWSVVKYGPFPFQ